VILDRFLRRMTFLNRRSRGDAMRVKATTVLLILNSVFWIYFWLDFAGRTRPYQPHAPVFDEPLPLYVFRSVALPWREEATASSLRLARLIEAPSFVATRLYVWRINKRPDLWNETFLGVSPGGYLLLIAMSLSFGQWYLVAWVGQKLWHRWFNHPTAAPSQAPSTTTTR
jgi:hypothetical protein